MAIRGAVALRLGAAARSSQPYPLDARSRQRRRHRQVREAVLERDGYKCRAVENGERCDVTDPRKLEAHHLVSLREGGTNTIDNGATLCRRHHRMIERADG
jgi:predicted restriction endonuclease